MRKVILITGASSGMGKSAAFQLLQEGHIVYGAARRVDEMEDLRRAGAQIISLDLTQDESIESCIRRILTQENQIDVLINNAGYGSYGAVEEVPIGEARRQFEVNLFGLARITQLVLPGMRAQKSGRIINISSMGGRMYTPFGAWYHATKHALEGWSDSLRLELRDLGIKVVVIEPGVIQTPWSDIAVNHLIKTSGKGPYAPSVRKFAEMLQELYGHRRATPPDELGRLIAHAATISRPRTRYAKGFLAKPAMVLRYWLGDRLYDQLFWKQLNGLWIKKWR